LPKQQQGHNLFSQSPNPAIVTRELPAKWQEKALERALMTMLMLKHAENVRQHLSSNRPICTYFTFKQRSYPLYRSEYRLIQQA
jgi:hypothetical protein